MYVFSPGVAVLTTDLPSSNLNFSPVSSQIFLHVLTNNPRNSLPPSMMHCVDVRVQKPSLYEVLSANKYIQEDAAPKLFAKLH